MSWTADPHALEQLKHIFKGTLSSNNEERRLANEALIEAKQQPEIENYLFDLLISEDDSARNGTANGTTTSTTTTRSDVRAAAGINLKNNILKNRTLNRSYLTDNIMKGLMSSDSLVRSITGNVITSMFSIYGLQHWSSALTDLLSIIQQPADPQHGKYVTQEAAMSALSKICEDSYLELDRDFNNERPLNFLMGEFLKLIEHHPDPKIKAGAIHCINQFIPLNTQSFLVVLDNYLGAIFTLAGNDSQLDDEMRKNICTSFLLIVETRPDKLMPHLDGVVNYCLHLMQQDTSLEVSLEACEFMLALATNNKELKAFNAEKLKLILPILLDKMVYSEEEIFLIEIADSKDDAHVVDKDEDIKPTNAKSKDTRNGNLSNGNGGSDSDDEDDDDDDDGELAQWSLRKCAAATLDVLSESLPADVLVVTLPILQEKIVSPHWPAREAAILAFGAMSTSCMKLARDKLPTLVPFLVDRLQDTEPRVRQITCWTLSRYSTWVSEEAHEGGEYASYFQPTFQSIVTCALDSKKIVQEAACSALSSFIEESDSSLIEFYLLPLLEHFSKCFQIYQRKNLIILYDCVQTFVEKMGYENLSKNPEYASLLLPPLLTKWEQLDDEDTALWPLLECMASIASSLREIFAPYAVPVYDRALKILSNCILLDQECQTDPAIDPPEKDFMVTSLDLVDGLIQGFEYHSVDLINQNKKSNLLELLLICFEDYNGDVRQSAYALLGDLAIFTIDLLKPYLRQIFISIGNEVNNRTYETYPIYNNAIWSLGEIAIRLPKEDTQEYISNFLDLLIPVINSNDIQSTVIENAAICLGRLGINTPELVAPRVNEFINSWCAKFVYLIDNNDEKESSFRGMMNMVAMNPDAGLGGVSTTQQGKKTLAALLECIVNYADCPSDLQVSFIELIKNYKGLLEADGGWNQVLGFIHDQEIRNRLNSI
ncbi:Importin subunit beta-2 [Candida viswanathii]|uniref:Importin subunit beta-2 n=1 Tax=Candida viswanathii TaxID=5486 RepID=A0A367YLI0_9ASCO|nr:Importin subunit beta-2 [Candida viswanathii]